MYISQLEITLEGKFPSSDRKDQSAGEYLWLVCADMYWYVLELWMR